MIPVLGFVLGIFVLIKTSNWAVDLSVKFSEITGLTKTAVGVIIIALMTSLPELTISITSSISNANHIMFGTLFGSTVADILLVFGIGLVYGIKTSKENFKQVKWIMILTSVLLIYGLFYGFNINLGLLSVIIFLVLSKKLLARKTKNDSKKWDDIINGLIILFKLTFAIAIILLSAELVTLTTVEISNMFGLSQTLIAGTIIAITCVLPELCVTISSVRKREYDIGIGNIFGSCFVNIAFILGLGIIIAPVIIGLNEVLLIVSLFISYMIVFSFLYTKTLDRFAGLILLLFYVLYILGIGVAG